MERKRAGTDNAGEDRPAAKVQRGRRGSLPGAADTTQPEEPSDDKEQKYDEKGLGGDAQLVGRGRGGGALAGDLAGATMGGRGLRTWRGRGRGRGRGRRFKVEI